MRVIGLMSGTSVDGIDAALVEMTGTQAELQVKLLAGGTYAYSPDLQAQIVAVCGGAALSMAELADLDDAIATEFAQAALTLAKQQYAPVDLIGSHGQTVFHRPPNGRMGYSQQLGRGELIAQLTQIETVSNFRVADIAAGGQGAPLVPPVDAALLSHPTCDRAVQNLGGISNLTYLPATTSTRQILGWDTGPGNLLLDLAVQHFSGGAKTYDQNGAWAAMGTPCHSLVERWLQQPFFQHPPPKSTGRELFGADYLHQCLRDAAEFDLMSADVLATLTELTAAAITQSYRTWLPQLPQQVLLCGGGSHNRFLRDRLAAQLPEVEVLTTSEVGLDADCKEAIAFAVLAYWRKMGIPGNLPAVTGARRPLLLGALHPVY
jgi:anhydro-N-acetylmuramic acid kinase